MTHEYEADAPEDDYTVAFADDSDWFDLLLHEGTREEAEQLAARHVAGFNPLHLSVGREELHAEFLRLAREVHEDGAVNAGASFTEDGTLLALMTVHSLGEDGVTRPDREAFLPQLLRWDGAKAKAEPEIQRLDLGPGPALRVRLLLAEKRLLGFGSRILEAVRYAVWPTGQEEIITMDVWWRHPERGDELAAMADALAQGMRIVPDSAAGTQDFGPGAEGKRGEAR
ncbi:hypothetical protein HUT18_25595 [Streptomyces sp. NA04227]|uniref:hypothetical protein n=1 Tax=Streptomyces sp. NA04227 TaxID=2742136 RepID=UPI00159200D4|nr:hypothetical protein [Streptomyces sp. NA04227]QKW09253.1 hypothetical protein HUT18_25595 [Streptomyces sp. NA04227]